ncbi:MAG: flavodoxin domain-containing protein [Actinomycetes bacterium]|jgi:menaquinone-dependent protoporphyrinogen IX oxidase|nr:flavodoxin domain-containing protein [Actinomycetes bacterium]
MSRILVAYKSHYGSTRQYAEWIAEELGADFKAHREIKPQELMDYDCVVYGGALYAGGIIGLDLVTKHPTRHLVLFTVGAADPASTDYTVILNRGLSGKPNRPDHVFHLRGMLDYPNMTRTHRVMMAMKKRMVVGNKKTEELLDEDRAFLETYGKKVGFLNRATIAPLVDYVRSQGGT